VVGVDGRWSMRWWFDGSGEWLRGGRLLLVIAVAVLALAALVLSLPEDRAFIVVVAVLAILHPPHQALDRLDKLRKGAQPGPRTPPVRPAGWYRFLGGVYLVVAAVSLLGLVAAILGWDAGGSRFWAFAGPIVLGQYGVFMFLMARRVERWVRDGAPLTSGGAAAGQG
jgi:hypothetical protein